MRTLLKQSINLVILMFSIGFIVSYYGCSSSSKVLYSGNNLTLEYWEAAPQLKTKLIGPINPNLLGKAVVSKVGRMMEILDLSGTISMAEYLVTTNDSLKLMNYMADLFGSPVSIKKGPNNKTLFIEFNNILLFLGFLDEPIKVKGYNDLLIYGIAYMWPTN